MFILSFLTSSVGKYIGIALFVVSLIGAGALWWNEHNNAIAAAQKAADAQALIQASDNRRIAILDNIIAGMQAERAIKQQIINQATQIKKGISNAPVTSACVSTPAIKSAIGGLLGNSAANSSK